MFMNITLKRFGSILLWGGLALLLLGGTMSCFGFCAGIGGAFEGDSSVEATGLSTAMAGIITVIISIVALVAGLILKAVGNATERDE